MPEAAVLLCALPQHLPEPVTIQPSTDRFAWHHPVLSASAVGSEHLRRGESVPAGPDAGSLFIVRSGAVRLTLPQPATGRITVLSVLGPGEAFGALPELGTSAEATTATALEPTVLCRYDAEAAADAFARNPELMRVLLRQAGRRMRALERRMAGVLRRDARQRVAFVLDELLENWSAPREDGSLSLDLRLTHAELAGLAGLTRETVSVTLAEFDLMEIIATEGRRLIVLDRGRLRAVSDGRETVPTLQR